MGASEPSVRVTARTGLDYGRDTAIGTIQFFTVQLLALAAGFLIAAFLTRQLGPELYGLYSVAATLAIWVKVSVVVMFNRTTIKFVAEAENWHGVVSTLAQTQFFVSLVAAAFLVLAAPALAAGLRSAELATYLRLFALEIPIFALVSVHRSTLIGKGNFGRGALLNAGDWLSRLALVFLLVGLGLSVTGAILASIGASVAVLIMARCFVQPGLLSRSAFPVRRIASYALPLFIASIGMRLFMRLDLLMVKALSDTTTAAGYYGAAQNLTIVPLGMFAISFTPLLIATLPQLFKQGEEETARAVIRQALRLLLCLLPFAGLAAGSAPEIVSLVYGDSFRPASRLVALLIFAALAGTMISVTTSILIAAGRPGLIFALTGPLAPLALAAHLFLVPHFGAIGAAVATTALAWLGAGATTLAVYRHCGVFPAPATILRVALALLIAYVLSSAWHTSGMWVILELSTLTAVTLICLFLLGELTLQDLDLARSMLRGQTVRGYGSSKM